MSNNVSVGDFAEQLLMSEQAAQTQAPVPMAHPVSQEGEVNYGQTPDISNVQVPTSFIESLVESKGNPVVETPQPQAFVQPVASPQPLEENKDILYLIEEVRALLEDVKQVLSEVTSVGMGVGIPNNAPKTPKDKGKEEKSVEDLLNSIMKSRRNSVK
jgi:hypothetical protein